VVDGIDVRAFGGWRVGDGIDAWAFGGIDIWGIFGCGWWVVDGIDAWASGGIDIWDIVVEGGQRNRCVGIRRDR
jgi:hypothetical protein